MFKYDNRVLVPSGHDLNIEDYLQNLEKYNKNYKHRPSKELLIDFENRKEFLKSLIEEEKGSLKFLESDKFYKDTKQQHNGSVEKIPTADKVLIFPSFQFNSINQLEDKEILENLLNLPSLNKISLSSGYLNMTDFIVEKFKNSKYDVDIITSSPRANGFYNAGFLKKNIPKFYRIFEIGILNRLRQKLNVRLYEYEKEGWTFHSKGIWLYENNKQFPSATVIGSSNYSRIFLNRVRL